MKTRRVCSRKPATVATSRWLAYVTASAASALAGAGAAEGAIHYSGAINQRFGGTAHASFLLNPGGGVLSFNHQIYTNSSHFAGGSGLVHIFAPACGSIKAGFVICPYTTIASALPLQGGEAVSGGPFVPDAGLMGGWFLNTFCGFDNHRGQFHRGEAFIGFKFNNGGGDQYGWARIQSRGAPVNRFTLVDYAYGDVGDPIRAGQKTIRDIPKGGSLVGLALGAAGLMAWRRQRARVAPSE